MAPALNFGVVVVVGMMGLVVLVFLPEVESAGQPREHFLFQEKVECHHRNGTERVRFLDRYFYDRQEYARFDSDRGEFEAVTKFGERDVQYWNSQKAILENARSAVDYFCRHNYGILEPFARERKGESGKSCVCVRTCVLIERGGEGSGRLLSAAFVGVVPENKSLVVVVVVVVVPQVTSDPGGPRK